MRSNESGEIWERFILSPSRCAKSIRWWWKNWGIIWKMRLQNWSLDCLIFTHWKSRLGLDGIPESKEHVYLICIWTSRKKGIQYERVPFMVVPVAHALNDWRVRSTSEETSNSISSVSLSRFEEGHSNIVPGLFSWQSKHMPTKKLMHGLLFGLIDNKWWTKN